VLARGHLALVADEERHSRLDGLVRDDGCALVTHIHGLLHGLLEHLVVLDRLEALLFPQVVGGRCRGVGPTLQVFVDVVLVVHEHVFGLLTTKLVSTFNDALTAN
jgi:hypothetical protein